MRWLLSGTKSILMLSLRVSSNVAGVPIQLLVPCWNPAMGNGYEFSSACPLGLMRSLGMMPPGKHPLWSVAVHGSPVSGSRIRRPLKSPLRIAAVGTIASWFSTERIRSHSSPQKKNSFDLSELKPPGM